MIAQPINQKNDMSCGGQLVAADGRVLPLQRAILRVDAKAGLARVVLEQTFANPNAEPLAVTYALALPHDAVVSGYAFSVGDRRVVGEVDRRAAARERFEQALIEGHSAALLEQDRSSLFTQEIGNVPPGAHVVCEIVIDQRLRWLEEGLWEWRFPTVVAPRYLGPERRVPDAERVTQDVTDGALPTAVSLALQIHDAVFAGTRPDSPSHAIAVAAEGEGFRVAFDAEDARLDRDTVVRWPVARPCVGVTIDTGRLPTDDTDATVAYGLLTLVPPAATERYEPLVRDVIVLLDTSGSMSGEPLDQAKRLVAALIDTLSDRDRLELIAFSSTMQRWRPGPVAATSAMRREALAWLHERHASGGTEMLDGIVASLHAQREDAQRQVIVVTDGLIGFEGEVVRAISERLPAQSRLHTVGVGSAVNRTLTASAARAGRGAEVIIGLGEDPDPATQRLLARTSRPLVVGLEISGSALLDHAPARLPDLNVGAPALVALRLRAAGGELRVRGRTAIGEWEECLQVAPISAGTGNPALAALYARERVEDLEMRAVATGPEQEIDAQIERIGLDFQITTRLTSWVAVSNTPEVDPREPLRRERMPQALPYGLSVEGLGLRRAAFMQPPSICASMAPDQFAPMLRAAQAPSPFFESRHRSVPAVPASLGYTRERLHRGRVVMRKERKLVVEFVADPAREIDWQPPRDVELVWDDGTLLSANLEIERSTRPGPVDANCSIRLTLVLTAEPPTGGRPVRVVVSCGPDRMVIEV